MQQVSNDFPKDSLVKYENPIEVSLIFLFSLPLSLLSFHYFPALSTTPPSLFQLYGSFQCCWKNLSNSCLADQWSTRRRRGRVPQATRDEL